jgi:predicted P-loop ATPase
LKSTALRTLAVRDEWFTDRLSHVASKDAMLETAGVLIIEIADSMRVRNGGSKHRS